MTKLAPPKLVDSRGQAVAIAQKPLAVGGEGSIYEVAGDTSIVAKVYNSPQSKERSEKLATMARLATPELQKIAAWPIATLHNAPGSPVAGILMPKLVGYKEIHHLYSVAQRKKDYPDADWRFLIHAARNCAIAFEEIHHAGHLVGDVNQKNVLVSADGIVQFVDCDSFQVRAANGRVFRCAVGVPEYTPPELLGKSFCNVDREENHDRFGLAVLIFHLIMMGRHPFSGVNLDAGDIPLVKAIQGGRFAYARDSQSRRTKPPPNTLPMSIVDVTIVTMFERAFATIDRSGPPIRPAAVDWKNALGSFLGQLGRCKVDPKHVYPKSVGHCPWCRLAGSNGVIFFLPGIHSVGGKLLPFDLVAVWGQIERIEGPSGTYTRPTPHNLSLIVGRSIPNHIPQPTPKPPLISLPVGPQKTDRFFDWLSGLLTQWWRKKALRELLDAENCRINLLNAELLRAWEAENEDWNTEYKARVIRKTKHHEELSRLETEITELDHTNLLMFEISKSNLYSNNENYERCKAGYSKDLQDLARRSEAIQKERYLEAFLIRDAKLKAIWSDRILSLSSFGIETALDVERLRQIKVPGIGPVLTDRLFAWRDLLAARFKPKAGVPDAERAVVDQRHFPRMRQLEAVLSDGPRQLREIVRQNDANRNLRMNQIQTIIVHLFQERADVEIMDRVLEGQRLPA